MEERRLIHGRDAGRDTRLSEPTLVAVDILPGVRLVVDLADHAIGLNILRGRFELNEIDFVRRTVGPGQHVVDVGAHVGLFAMHMAALVGASGSVHAFEPFEPSAACLDLALAINGFEDRVCVVRSAVGAEPCTAQLVFAPGSGNPGGAFVTAAGTAAPAGCEARPVAVVALDAYPLPRPTAFVKMDAEGSEPRIITGASRLLREDRPVILAEVSPRQLAAVAGVAAPQFIGQVADLGYRCYLLGAGVIGEEVTDLPNGTVTSVVFLPAEGQDGR